MRTESRSMLSSFCLGTTVTSSISHRKATSDGTSPEGRGNAMGNVRLSRIIRVGTGMFKGSKSGSRDGVDRGGGMPLPTYL